MTRDIRDFTQDELKELAGLGQPAYRAKQLFHWLYKRYAKSFTDMRNIPSVLRDKLASRYRIGSLGLSRKQVSKDGTEKFLFRLQDGNFIETVLISAGRRKTVCISSQVGCRFACVFCASGRQGFIRDLSASEILGQALYIMSDKGNILTNYVFMGMGEPLDNFSNLKRSLLIMTDRDGLDIGARRITVSTCGVTPRIKELSKLGLQVNLSISLHACRPDLRSELMPANRRYPLKQLIKACMEYAAAGGRMVTFEYVLIKGKNDSSQDAQALASLSKKVRAKVNIIMCSATDACEHRPPRRREAEMFVKKLKENGASATLRRSKGADIQAACGQLACRLDGKGKL